MNTNELKQAIELHKLWLVKDPKCKQLSLVGVDLSHADLRNTNLRFANLANSILTGANLSGAESVSVPDYDDDIRTDCTGIHFYMSFKEAIQSYFTPQDETKAAIN